MAAVVPRLAANKRGDAVVMWEQASTPGGLAATYYRPATGWEPPELRSEIHGTSWHSIAMDDAGNAAAVWQQRADFNYQHIWGRVYLREENALLPPALDIKVEESDGPVTIPAGEIFKAETRIRCGSFVDEGVEVWLVAKTPLDVPGGWHYFKPKTGWIPGIYPSWRSDCNDTLPYQVWHGRLSPGKYTVYFLMDTEQNGEIDQGSMVADRIVVNIE